MTSSSFTAQPDAAVHTPPPQLRLNDDTSVSLMNGDNFSVSHGHQPLSAHICGTPCRAYLFVIIPELSSLPMVAITK